MKFFLETRKTEECDIDQGNMFPPDEEEYEMYLNALHEDISRIESVSSVERSESIFSIETTGAVLAVDLKQLLIPALTPDLLKKLRVISVTESLSAYAAPGAA